MIRRDPWNHPRAIHVPGRFASVAPLPKGTKVGNVRELADDFQPLQDEIAGIHEILWGTKETEDIR